MRPIKLTIQAFGPFAKNIQIEFDKLGQSNIFLISGVTGSGKTSIFDAICFALFNSSSGSIRGNNTLKSHYVDDNIDSFVEFIFEFNQKIFKIVRQPSFERKKTRGEGYILEQARAQLFLPDGKIIEKVKDVDEYIVDLLGVDVAQFSQIALLAQGEFLKLLNSDTIRRGEVFRNIFKTWKYADFSQKLKEKTFQIKDNYERLEESILQYIADIKTFKDDLKVKKEVFIENKAFINLEELINLLELQNNADNKSLIDYQKEVENCEKKISSLRLDFQKVQNKNDLILQKNKLQSAIVLANNEFDEIKKEYKNIDKLKDVLNKTLIEIQKNEVAFKKAKQIQQLNFDKQKLDLDKNMLENNILILKENHLQFEFNNLNIEIDKLAQAQQKFVSLQGEIEEKTNLYNKKYNQYLSMQAGILAKNLMDNKPCPVCGSLNHPKPAKITEENFTKEELDELKRNIDNLNNLLVEKTTQCSVLIEKISSLKTKIEKLSNEYKIEINSVNLAIKEIEFEYELKKICAHLDNVVAQIQSIDVQIQLLSTDIEKIEIAKIEKKHLELNENYKQIEANINNIEKRYNEKNIEIETLKSNFDLMEKQIQQIIVDDINVANIELEIKELKEKLEFFDKQIQEIILRKGINENILNALISKNKEYNKISKQYSDYKILSDCANGNLKGKQRLAFEQYIQGYYLDLVLIEANKYLKIMSQNQFQLLRKKDDFALNSKSGLELEVMDFHTFKKRSTKTLSGGESFKAALSLALGLSNCVSSLSGALNIDALFIDEGFGSLDSESLELAVDVIFDLSSNNRLIGVISHIEDLKNKIQNQILVQKSQNGSDIVVNF